MQRSRLFQSPWPYLGFVALFTYDVWRDAHPRPHPASTPWHPVFFGVEFALTDVFCICLIIGAIRLTSVAIERAALALLALSLCLSIIGDLHAAGHLPAALPSSLLLYLILNLLLVLLLAIRFAQVLREPPISGILTQSATPSE